MTPEKQRIAIAEACGWERNNFVYPKYPFGEIMRWKNGDKESESVPDYLNDLNAMHEAEKVLGNDLSIYFELLTGGDDDYEGCYKAMCATAAQRAEAFLKTIGKWEEE